jgi:hypothetical protein
VNALVDALRSPELRSFVRDGEIPEIVTGDE